jgi:hypothetical protein
MLQAAIVMNSLLGNSNAGVFGFSNCDYHSSIVADKEGKDYEIGFALGNMLEAAAQLNTSVFFVLITDGGVNMGPVAGGKYGVAAITDGGARSGALFGFFDYTKQPSAGASVHYVNGAQQNLQLGYCTSAGAVTSTLVGGGNAIIPAAFTVNYLSVLNRLGDIAKYSPVPLTTTQIDALRILA